ncbi:hypothetical protein EV360DRAFT_88865 [Lentinula raphanica]|nr:hypothetical protein EV360DRAFT_88865 [Lentinula raphanica]
MVFVFLFVHLFTSVFSRHTGMPQCPRRSGYEITFIPRILTSIRQDITVEDRANLPKIIGFVNALKAPDVATAIASRMDAVTSGPNADSTSSELPITSSSTGVVTDKVRLWAGLFVGKEPVWLGAPLEERKEADPAICFGGFFCLYYGKDGHVHNVDMYKAGEGKRPAAGFYKDLPIVLSTMFRRKYVQHAALQTMMNVETLLTKTNTPKDALNPKSYIHVAVKSNCKNLLPHLSEAEYEKHVVPEIVRIVDLLESEDPSEGASSQSNEPTAEDAEDMGEV